MTQLEETTEEERTSLDDAILKVLEALGKRGGMNVSQVARATSLNWKTADKVLTLLIEISVMMEGKGIDVYDAGNSRMFMMTEKAGFESLPASLRDLYIKQEFPEASDEQKLLVSLLLEGATNSRMAILLGDEKSKTLQEKGRIKETKDGRYYLTDLGLRIARGTLRTYPELVR